MVDEIRDDRRAGCGESTEPGSGGFARGRPAQVERHIACGKVRRDVRVRRKVTGDDDAILDALRGDVGTDIIVIGRRSCEQQPRVGRVRQHGFERGERLGDALLRSQSPENTEDDRIVRKSKRAAHAVP